MARYCFYCNRELAPGESCQCRLKARENMRRAEAAAEEPAAAEQPFDRSDAYHRRTTSSGPAHSARSRTRTFVDRAGIKPTLKDFARPLDQLDRERPNLAAAVVWISITLFTQGLFVALLTTWRLFFAGVLYGLVSLALLAILLFIQIRVRLRQPFRLEAVFAHARPVFLYASLFYLLAALSGAGNPLFGLFLFIMGDFAIKSGLLWQIRQNSPLERNRYFLQALLTIVVHTLFQSILIQSFLGSLTAAL